MATTTRPGKKKPGAGEARKKKKPTPPRMPRREPPPPCPCSIRVVPFNCRGGTCQFGGQQGTEPGGIRYDVRGPDDLHLLIRIQLANAQGRGRVEIQRQAPDRR